MDWSCVWNGDVRNAHRVLVCNFLRNPFSCTTELKVGG